MMRVLPADGQMTVRFALRLLLEQEPEAYPPALAAGIEAFVSKSEPPERVLAVIRGL